MKSPSLESGARSNHPDALSPSPFAAAFDALPDATVILGADGIVRHANRAAAAFLGAEKAAIVGQHCHELFHDTAIDAANCPVCRQIACGPPAGDIEVFSTGRRLHISLSPFRDGASAGCVHVVRAPRSTDERPDRFTDSAWRTLLDTAPLCIFVKDAESRLIACNRRFAELSGFDPAQVIGKSIYEFHPRAMAERFRAEDLRIMERGVAEEFEDTYISNGRRFTAHVVKTPLRDEQGRVIGVLGVLWDLAERLRAEEALRESESRYQAILANASDAILMSGPDGRFIDANRRAEELFGYSREELLQLSVPDIHAPDNHENREKAFRMLDETGASLVEHHLQRKDGTSFHAEVSGSRIEWGGDHLYLGNFRDISDRKRTEEELNAYRDHLEELVEERTRELKRMNRELESFGYSVSHDLRAPLRAINGFSAILREELEGQLSGDTAGLLDRIQTATVRMADLIDGLLSLSRVSRGELQATEVDLSALANSISVLYGDGTPYRLVSYRIEPGLSAEADPAMTRVLLENLFSNAWKFTSTRSDALIEFGRALTPEGDAFFIRDNGVGFDSSYTHKLFRPFERLHTPAEFPGTGIGLATVRRIVERHGGRVWAEGEPDRGATIYFTLGADRCAALQ